MEVDLIVVLDDTPQSRKFGAEIAAKFHTLESVMKRSLIPSTTNTICRDAAPIDLCRDATQCAGMQLPFTCARIHLLLTSKEVQQPLQLIFMWRLPVGLTVVLDDSG